MVVEVDVRDHPDLGRQREHRPVGLVSLDDEPAAARARVPAELRHLAADAEGGIVAERVEAVRDHRRGGRLPMCARDDDRAPETDELGEQLGAAPPRDLAGVGGRDDRLRPRRRLRRLGRDRHLDARRPHVLEVRRLVPVPAGHLGPPRLREDRVAGEARAADPREPEAATLKLAQARSAPGRRRRRRRASPARASAAPMDRSRSGSASSSSTCFAEVELRFGDDDGAAAPREVLGVLRLMVGGRVRIRNEQGGLPGGGHLPHRASGAGDDQVGRRERRAELVREGKEPVVVATRARRPSSGIVALPGEVEDRQDRRRRTRRGRPR